MTRPLRILLSLLFSFLLGLLQASAVPTYAILVLISIALVFIFINRQVNHALYALWFAFGAMSSFRYNRLALEKPQWMVARVEKKLGGNARQSVVRVLSVQRRSGWQGVRVKALVYGDSNIGYVGSDFLIYGVVDVLRGPRRRDFEGFYEYLRRSGVHQQVYAKHTILLREGGGWRAIVDEFRRFTESRIDELEIAEEAKGILLALYIGDKRRLTERTKSIFSTSGTSHVLSVSGLHVGIVFGFYWWLTGWCKRYKWFRFVFGVILLVCFALIAGLRPSVVRSVLMASLAMLGMVREQRSTFFIVVVVSALIFVVLEPRIIYEVGFLLSYSAVLGIVVVSPTLLRLFDRLSSASWYHRIGQFISVSVSAQLFTAPIVIMAFGTFSTYFLVGNAVALPLIPIVMGLGGVAMLFAPVMYLGVGAQYALEKLFDFLLFFLETVSSWPYASLAANEAHAYVLGVVTLLSLIFALPIRAVSKRYGAITLLFTAVLLFPQQKEQHYVESSDSGWLIDDTVANSKNLRLHVGSTDHPGVGDIYLLRNEPKREPVLPGLVVLSREMDWNNRRSLKRWADSTNTPIWDERRFGFLQFNMD